MAFINGAFHQREVTSGMSNQVVGKSFKKKKRTGNSINVIRTNILRQNTFPTARSQADWIWDPRSSQKWGHCFILSPCPTVSRVCFSRTPLPSSSLQLPPGLPKRKAKAYKIVQTRVRITLPGLPPSSSQWCSIGKDITSKSLFPYFIIKMVILPTQQDSYLVLGTWKLLKC